MLPHGSGPEGTGDHRELNIPLGKTFFTANGTCHCARCEQGQAAWTSNEFFSRRLVRSSGGPGSDSRRRRMGVRWWCGSKPQQPRPATPGHQPSGGGGAVDAADGGDLPEVPVCHRPPAPASRRGDPQLLAATVGDGPRRSLDPRGGRVHPSRSRPGLTGIAPITRRTLCALSVSVVN
jgi:hypothetical protein